MKFFRSMLVLLCLASFANANMSFVPSKKCKSCHNNIYEEFIGSMHFNATPSKDPIHKAVWDRHPKNTKANKYVCAKCHAPTADNLDDMLGKGEKYKGIKALPEVNNKTHQEAISCAYCHRIDSVRHGKMSNKNVISEKDRHYYGTMKEVVKSTFHTTSSENKNFKDGSICMGCHSHKANNSGLNVCSTNEKNDISGHNCVSCHMPQVKGLVSYLSQRKTHAFHGFPGAHFNQEMLSKYIDIKILNNSNGFEISVNNKSPHALLLHPLRLAKLMVTVDRGGKKIEMKPYIFVRVIGKEGKATPPWIANAVLKDTMVHGNERKTVTYATRLQKGDKVTVHLGHYLVKPKALKKFGLQNTEAATKFYTLKKKIDTIMAR